MKLLEIAIAVHIDEKMRSNWDPIGSLSNLIKGEVDSRCKLILRVCEMQILGKIAGQFANYFQVKNYVHHKQPHLRGGGGGVWLGAIHCNPKLEAPAFLF